MKRESTQVAIVGGGPVGAGLAIELGQRGIRCVLIEKYLEPQRIPKGQNLTQRTLEHFHFWNAESALRAARTIPSDYGIGGLTTYGTLLSTYSYDWMQRELVRPYYYTANDRLPQYATEAVLRDRVSQLPSVQALYGWKAQSVQELSTHVEIKILTQDGMEETVLSADYVVGCDGSRSLVRQEAGITQTLSDHDRMMVLLVFRSTELHELLKCYPGKSYYNVLHPDLKGYWRFFGRVDLGTTWFFHAPVPTGTTRDNFDFRKFLHEAVGTPFEVEFEHIGFWDLRFAMADTYRSGRMFVAGDAAHSHPPYGGYGVNTGFEDARNIGWKLAAVLQGWGKDALLDSYDRERRPVFASTANDFIAHSIETDRVFVQDFHPERDRTAFESAWQKRSEGTVGEVHSFEPHYEGSPVVVGDWVSNGQGGSAVGRHDFKARAGHHLAPALLSSGRNIYEVLGTGYSLIALSADAQAITHFQSAATALGLPLTVIKDTAEQERLRYSAALILVRPDQFVAWVGPPTISSSEAVAVLKFVSG